MGNFRSDFAWQERFYDTVRYIVGPLLLEPAGLERDMAEATDFMVLKARDMRIGCRIRRAASAGGKSFSDRYPWEFTLRSHRDSGAKTELAKILEGWGDWLFYGHAAHNDLPSLARWFVLDLHEFRLLHDWPLIKCVKQKNKDGTHFHAYDILSFGPEILVACSLDYPGMVIRA